MGQDRELSENQRRIVLETVLAFKQAWEKAEQANLTADRDRKIAYRERDVQSEVEENATLIDNLENQIETAINSRPEEEFEDDTQRDLALEQERLKAQAVLFKDAELWKNWLSDICS